MSRFLCLGLAVVSATLGFIPCAGAVPSDMAAPHIYAGFFGKVRVPRINVGKGIKAVAYPVTKTAVSGGKAVISGGETAAKVYSTWHTLSPNSKAIPSVPRLP